MEKVTFGRGETVNIFRMGSGAAVIQARRFATPPQSCGCQEGGNIFAHKAFYRPGQWGVNYKGSYLIQCIGGNSFSVEEEKNQEGNVTIGNEKQHSGELIRTFHSWQRTELGQEYKQMIGPGSL